MSSRSHKCVGSLLGVSVSILAFSCLFSLSVTSITLVETGQVSMGATFLLISRALFVLISIYYYYQVGRRPKKV